MMILIIIIAIVLAGVRYLYRLESRIFLVLLQRMFFRPQYGPAIVHDIGRRFAGHRLLEEKWLDIRQEFDEVISRTKHLPKLHEVDPANSKISFTDGPAWNTIILKAYDGWFKENCSLFPKTYSLLSSIPDVSTVMFSILAPYATIPPHTGKFAGIYRYQLGLIVPQRKTHCYIQVDGERYHWQEGAGVLFDDTYLHSVTNDTPEQRVVLFLDVKKQSSGFYRKVNAMMLKIIQSSPVFRRAQKSGIIDVG